MIDLRNIIRILPIKRGRAFLIRVLSTLIPGIRYTDIEVFNHKIKIDLKDDACIGLFLNFGEILFEKEIFSFLDSIIESKDVFWDVGANIGYYTLFLSNRCKVISFEPNPKLFDNLKKAAEMNKNIMVLNYALTNLDGKINFFLNKKSSDLSSIRKNRSTKVLIVKSRTIDSLISIDNLEPPTIIKIDVEGYEYQVLEGFKLMKELRPIVIFEYIPEFGQNNNIDLIKFNELFGSDWQIFRFMVNGKLNSNYLLKNNFSTNNFLAVHKSSNRFIKIERFISKL